MCAPAPCHGSISDTCFRIIVTTAVTVNKKTVGDKVKTGLDVTENLTNNNGTGYSSHVSCTQTATSLKTNWMDFKGVFTFCLPEPLK